MLSRRFLSLVTAAALIGVVACGGGSPLDPVSDVTALPDVTVAPSTVETSAHPIATVEWTPGVRGEEGALVDIGGRRLSVACAGTGSPTVIFEAAAGFSRRDWRFVQSLVAPETRACAYTRAGTEGHGLGELGSDPPAPEDVIAEFDGVYVATAQSTVDDLSALLAAAQIEPPYVLVGHSLGGIYIRLFADRHPDLVAGLVFVDSSHPTQIERFEEILPAPARQSTIEDKISDAFASVVRSAADTGPFGDLPVAILSADPKEGIAEQIRSGVSEDTARAMAALWTELQTDLLNLSTNATREVAENAQHFVHSADPQLVTDTIIDVVRQARGRAATAGGR